MKDLKLYAPGLLGYAAVLGMLGALLHWHVGPQDIEGAALLFVLGMLVPSAAVENKNAPLPTAVVTPVALLEKEAEKEVVKVAEEVLAKKIDPDATVEPK